MLGTFSNWIDLVARSLATEGVDLAARLDDHGVSLSALDEDARLDPALTRLIWRIVEGCSTDPVFGLSMARRADFADFEELGVALVATGHAEAVLDRLVRYETLLSDNVSMQLRLGPRIVDLRVAHDRTHWRVGEFAIALVMRLLRVRFDRTLSAELLTFGFENPDGVDAYKRYFRGPVIMGGTETRLSLDRAVLARSASRDSVRVSRRLERVLQDRADELVAGATAAATVRRILLDCFGREPPTLDRVAATMLVGPRTLQRRLAQEGTTFAAELDQARREAAERWLEEGRLTRTEIAYLLGFTQPSSFSRALRRWTRQP